MQLFLFIVIDLVTVVDDFIDVFIDFIVTMIGAVVEELKREETGMGRFLNASIKKCTHDWALDI